MDEIDNKEFFAALHFYGRGTYQDYLLQEKMIFENFPKQLKLLCVETQLMLKYVRFLHTEEEITSVLAKFEEGSGFKNCIGIIDGTHVAEHVALTALGKDIIYMYGYVNRNSEKLSLYQCTNYL